MKPTQRLIDELYRDSVLRARAMSPQDKLLAGARLFDMACRVTMDGIRNQYPNADEASVRAILTERLALRERLEEFRR